MVFETLYILAGHAKIGKEIVFNHKNIINSDKY